MNGDIKDNTGIKMLTTFFAGVILTGIAAFISYPHNLPTTADIDKLQVETSTQLSEMQKQNNSEQDEITLLRIELAKIAFKLHIEDGP
jgi:hypothetical protein